MAPGQPSRSIWNRRAKTEDKMFGKWWSFGEISVWAMISPALALQDKINVCHLLDMDQVSGPWPLLTDAGRESWDAEVTFPRSHCWECRARLKCSPNFRPHTLFTIIWKMIPPHTSCWFFLSDLAFWNSGLWTDKDNPRGQSGIFQNLWSNHHLSALIYWSTRVPR